MTIWKPIHGYENIYEISNTGEIKSCARITKNGKTSYKNKEESIRTICVNNKRHGYCEITLYKNNIGRRYKVHRLVGTTFIPNVLNKPEINHIDGNKLNNAVNNLEWVTSIENKQHGWKNGLYTGNHLKRKITCATTGVVFESVADCARILNIDRRGIFRMLKGEKNHVKGLTFFYINE